MNDELIHERLRQVLRDGDPAAQEAGLTPDEVHAMRRAVLTSIPESRRRFAWLPVLATGTAALIVLALIFARTPGHRPPASLPAAPQIAVIPTPVPAPPVLPAPAAPSQRSTKSVRPAHRRTVRPPQAPPARHDEPMTLASLPETSTVREIRFSTPCGTRIIWELPTEDAR